MRLSRFAPAEMSPRPSARRPAAPSRRAARAARSRWLVSELAAVLKRLLQVVSDDLLDLGQTVGRNHLDEGRKPLVQVGAELLRDGRVRGVADQTVLHPIALLPRYHRPVRPE